MAEYNVKFNSSKIVLLLFNTITQNVNIQRPVVILSLEPIQLRFALDYVQQIYVVHHSTYTVQVIMDALCGV